MGTLYNFAKLYGARLNSFKSVGDHLQHFLVADVLQLTRFREEAGVGGINAVDIGVSFADFQPLSIAARATAVVSEPPLPRVVISMSSGNALEAGHNNDIVFFQLFQDAGGVDTGNPRPVIRRHRS